MIIQQTPRLAILSSFAGFGRISITAALPIVSVMKVQACPLPAMVLSSHLAYSPCHKADMTDHIPHFLQAWQDIGVRFDGLYIGYLSNPTQLDIVQQLLATHEHKPSAGILKDNAKVIIDPVMGDHGKAYSTITPEHIQKMKDLVAKAHIITPNLTEACMLTDVSYHSDSWSEQDFSHICQLLDPTYSKQIVITGISVSDQLGNYIWDKGVTSLMTFPSAGAARPGTGDMFASILSANALKNVNFKDSVYQASDFISACILDSEQAQTPIKEGVLFEQNLSRLL